MKNKIIYGIIIIITFILSFIFRTSALHFLLGFEIALLVFMMISIIFLKRVDVNISIPYFRMQKNKEFKVMVKFHNRSILPITSMEVVLKCKNELTGKEFIVKDNVMMDGRSESVLEFYLKSGCLGKFKINIESVRVYDYLRIFSKKIKKENIYDEIMILPEIHKISVSGKQLSGNKYEWEQYSKTISGEDTSEVFDVHEFRPGDTMQKVHWKLTAKTNQYFVKEYSMPVENMMIIFLNLNFDEDWKKEEQQEKLDVFLEVLASLSWSLSRQRIPHIIIWYNSEIKNIEMAAIENEEDVYAMLERVCNSKLYDRTIDIKRIYQEKAGTINHGISLFIDAEGRFFIENNCMKKFSYSSLEKELMEWKLEI